MPRGDGTGPGGMGPLTGRGAGFCAGQEMPGYANPVQARGCGMRWGRGRGGGGGNGRGWRHQYCATGMPGWMRAGQGLAPVAAPTPETEKKVLENHVAALQAQLDAVRKRLDAVSAQAEKNSHGA